MHKKHLKNSTLFHNKNTQKLIEGNLFNIIKAIYEKSIANIILNDEDKTFPLRQDQDKKYLISSILSNLKVTIVQLGKKKK